MGSIKIEPVKLKGIVDIPPSKSIAHRAVICNALSGGLGTIENLDLSDDIIATIDGMKALLRKGAEGPDSEHDRFRQNLHREHAVIDCNESGSTLRFLIPISLAIGNGAQFIGRGNLGKRPLTAFDSVFDACGISRINGGTSDETLNLKLDGRLKPGKYFMEGNISSQFITGLFFALPLLEGDSQIDLTSPLESKGYLDLTLQVMTDYGVKIEHDDYKRFYIKGRQKYQQRNYRIEGDYSQGAFFLTANELGAEVAIQGLSTTSLQGDKAIIDILEALRQFGAHRTGETLYIDGSQCPDIIPIAAAAAALTLGRTEIIHAGRLRIKECDRLMAVCRELNKLGAAVTEKPEGLVIDGKERLNGGCAVWSHKDHRIAMTLAIAATRCEKPIILEDFECVSKSYPGFFEDYQKLGGNIHEWNVGQ